MLVVRGLVFGLIFLTPCVLLRGSVLLADLCIWDVIHSFSIEGANDW